MLRLALVVFAFAFNSEAQWFSVGITGGVPLSPHSATYPSATVRLSSGSFEAPNDFYQKPYAVGPTVDFNFPRNISFEAGMLHERFHRDASAGITPLTGGGVNFGYVTSVAANAFLFPLLAKFNFGRHRITPFIEGGATMRHLSTFTGQGIQLDFFLHPNSTAFRFDPDKSIDVAITAGGGFRYRFGFVDLVPEIRYLHWTAQYEQPVQNQAMLMVSIAFPARR